MSKKIFDQKKFWGKGFSGQKKINIKKNVWVKKIWVRNFFVLKTGRVNPRGRIYDFPPENRRVKIW